MILNVFKIMASRRQGIYDVFLVSKRHNKAVCVSVGAQEARLLDIIKNNRPVPKPMLCDVFLKVMYNFGIAPTYVRIIDFEDGVYHTRLCVGSYKKEKTYDCRLSDALCIALRTGCPIYMDEDVVKIVGFSADEFLCPPTKTINIEELKELALKVDVDMLEELLAEAVEKEDYEFAMLLRDKINEMKK